MSVPEVESNYSLSDLNLESQRFKNKEEIKPWLSHCLLMKKGINIVIERSDANKIIFKCRSNNKKEVIDMKIRSSSRRPISCPFKVRANYSLRNGHWTLVVMNENHDHELDENQTPNSNLFAKTERIVRPDDTVNSSSASKTSSTSDVFSSFAGLSSPETLLNNITSPVEDDEINGKRRNATEIKKRGKKTKSVSIESYEGKTSDEIVQNLRKEVNKLININIMDNKSFNENEKSLMIKSFASQFLVDYKTSLIQQQQQKSVLNSWLATPSSSQNNLNANASANLIPLSPLLNDSDTDYPGTNTSTSNATHSTDNLTHLPGINLGSSVVSNPLMPNNFMIPNQISQIQNQNQQLPSFNSIQNQLPVSPTGNNTTASLFGNNNIGSTSLVPPINNTNSTTLNPSHLLKTSNSKNNIFNINQTTSSLNLNEFKLNSPSNLINNNLFSAHTSNSSHSFSNLNTNAGVTLSNNNIINPTNQTLHNISSYYNRDNHTSGTSNQNSNSVNSGVINNIGNLSDTGW